MGQGPDRKKRTRLRAGRELNGRRTAWQTTQKNEGREQKGAIQVELEIEVGSDRGVDCHRYGGGESKSARETRRTSGVGRT